MRIAKVLQGAGRDLAVNGRLVALHWLLNGALALGVGFPALVWLARLDTTKASDALLTGLSLPTLLEMTPDPAAVTDVMIPVALWLMVFAVVLNAFVTGGTLGVLTAPAFTPALRRFLPAGGLYMSRFLKLLAVGALIGGGAWMVITGVGLVIGAALGELGEPATSIGLVFAGLVSVAAACFFVLALHFARIAIVLGDQADTLPAYLAGIKFVVRNPANAGGLLVVFGVLTGAVYATYLAFTWAFPAMTGSTIVALIVAQQVVMLARSALQVGLVAGELRLYSAPSQTAPQFSNAALEPTPSDVIRIDLGVPGAPSQPAEDEGPDASPSML